MGRYLILFAMVACGGGGGGGDGDLADAAPDGAPGTDASELVSHLMYVSSGDSMVLAMVRLETDGTMTPLTNLDVALPQPPHAMAYARTTRRLYVGLGNGSIATFDLDSEGTPSLQAMTTDTTNDPTYIGLLANESIIATAYFGADEIKTHDVSGDAPHPENATFATLARPHAAVPGPAGRFYVPHRDADTIRWFTIDGNGDPVLDNAVTVPAGTGPRHISFAPDFEHAYVANEMGNSVSTYSVAANGALTLVDTIPGIPSPVAGTDTGADIHVTPDGRFVYASFRGRDVLGMFEINGDGTLTSLGTVPTEVTPREFDVSPDGRFVIACGQGSGFLQSYRVESDGRLNSVDRIQIGGDLRWVIID